MLENAYSREHTRVTVRLPARKIWKDYLTWAKTRAETLEDDDDDNDMTDPDEILTLIVDFETDHGEYYEAVSQVNNSGKGSGPCHSYRVKRIPRGSDGELLKGNVMSYIDDSVDDTKDIAQSDRDRKNVIHGTYCFRSPKEETQSIFSDASTGKYKLIIIVRIFFITLFLFYCLLCYHSFPTNPNRIINCFKLFSLLQLTTTLLLRRFFNF